MNDQSLTAPLLTRKNEQPGKTPTPATTKTPTYKAEEVSRKHLFLDDLFLQEEIVFLRTELDSKQRIVQADEPSREHHFQ